MMKQRRRMLASVQHSILPSGYKQVEYLESTGTQYINTGIMFKNTNITINLDIVSSKQYETTKKELGVGWYAGTILGVTNNYWSNMYSDYTLGILCTQRMNFTMKYTLSNTTTTYYANGNIVGTRASAYLQQYAKLPFPLFAFANKETLKVFDGCRIYSFSFAYDDEIIANLVPCLDDNCVPCMYDTVSKQTFYNQGTGEFLYGGII